MNVFKSFTFEAAHRLPNVPPEHKCARLHGHSFHVEVHVEGDVGDESGWVLDFADIRDAFAPVHDALDHRYLNEIDGLENPTSEHLAAWLWEHIKDLLPSMTAVTLWETADARCVYRGL